MTSDDSDDAALALCNLNVDEVAPEENACDSDEDVLLNMVMEPTPQPGHHSLLSRANVTAEMRQRRWGRAFKPRQKEKYNTQQRKA